MLWLSERTDMAVVLIGIALSAAGVATAMLVPGARWLTLKDLDRVSAQVVVGNTYDAFTDQLFWSAGIMIVFGLAMVALGFAMSAGKAATDPAG